MSRDATVKRERQRKFLAAYARCGTISGAAAVVGVTPRAVRWWEEHDPAFAEDLDAVRTMHIEAIESHMYTLATTGRDMAAVRAAELLLRAMKPGAYRESREVRLTGPGPGGSLPVLVVGPRDVAALGRSRRKGEAVPKRRPVAGLIAERIQVADEGAG